MSLLANIGQGISAIAGIFGSQNRSVQGDCLDISDVGSYAAKLAKYPQCAPYISAAGPIGLPAPAVVPQIAPQIPQALPGGSTTIAPYTQQYPVLLPQAQTQSIAYSATPAMAIVPPMIAQLPKLAAPMASAAAGMLTAAAKKYLPTLSKQIALASGYTIVGNLVYTAAGQLIGKTRRRRRMNPLNYRAAKRAARRLCAVQDLCGQISKAIPNKPRRARRSSPFRRKRKC